MIKIKSTTDKDAFVAALDILELQGIKTSHIEEFEDFEGEDCVLVYSVFVNKYDVNTANALLEEFLLEEPKPEEIDYSIYNKDELLNELVYNVVNEQQRENILAALAEQGINEETIKQKIEEEIRAGYKQEHISSFELIMGFGGMLLLFGGPSLKMGREIYYSKKIHPITQKQFHEYDEVSRKYALIMIIGTIAVYAAILIFLIRVAP